jgi:hypothetical protein
MLGIYIRGTAPERIVDQVTCGDVGIEKAVVVPKPLFPLMLEKLAEFSSSTYYKSPWLAAWGARWALHGFLSRRSSKEFVSLYVEHYPDLLDRASQPGLSLDTVPEVRLAERLHEFGLLPEDKRKTFVETVSNYALAGQDAGALDDEGIRSLFKGDEFEHLQKRVRTELVPRLGDVRQEWESEHRSDDSPEEHMQPLLDSFEVLRRCFVDDESAAKIIDSEIQRTSEWIAEHTPEESTGSPRKLGMVEASDKPQSARSLFDDIDADDESESE